MKKPFLYSVIFHLVIVAMVFLKLPYNNKVIRTSTSIKVDIVSEIPRKVAPAPVKEVKKVEKPVKKVNPPKPKIKKPKPAPRKPKRKIRKPVKKTVKVPVKKTPEISKEEIEKRRQEEEKKKIEAEKKKKEDEFKSFLSDLESLDDTPTPSVENTASAIPLSYSEISEIKYQIQQCWQIPPSVATTNEQLVLKIRLNRDGSLVDVKVVDAAKYKANQSLRLLAESALRAVEKCSPLKNLPKEKFASWRDLELGFNPQDLGY